VGVVVQLISRSDQWQRKREKGPVMMFHRVMGHESQSRSGTRGAGPCEREGVAWGLVRTARELI
jgi:hypothetical protein